MSINTLCIWFSIGSFACLPSCKSRVGDPCREANEACLDDHTKLSCKNGRFMPLKCDGDRGCTIDKQSEKAACDFSGNKQGEKCDEVFAGARMCRDNGHAAIACRDGKFDVLPCRGAQGCKPTGPEPGANTKLCDTTLAKVGDTCDPIFSSQRACEVEGKSELACVNGLFALKRYCRGPKGCEVVDAKSVCDDSVWKASDLCEPGRTTCSDDKKAQLSCNFGRVTEKACGGPDGCSKLDDYAVCDTGVSPKDMGCRREGKQQCNVDGRSILVCKDAIYVTDKACKADERCSFKGSEFKCGKPEHSAFDDIQ